MWVRGAAIRPVPPYAVVSRAVLDAVENALGAEGDEADHEIETWFEKFEETQPAVAAHIHKVLSRPLDETALALGYFLSVGVWLAFDRAFRGKLAPVTEDALKAAEAALALEEELRSTHTEEPLELDDVMAIEQPAILAFLHEHVDAALDAGLGASEVSGLEGGEVDVDDVHLVYRAVLLETLALSHAVIAPDGALRPEELLA